MPFGEGRVNKTDKNQRLRLAVHKHANNIKNQFRPQLINT